MSSIAVIGTGYVGLTTAICLADIGHQVTGVDIDEAKVARLVRGEATIYEPGLEELMGQTRGGSTSPVIMARRSRAPISSSSRSAHRPAGGVRPTWST